MISTEKMVETMNPMKAYEAFTKASLFDVKAQSKLVESAADQTFEVADAYQSQTRKALELWLDRSEEVMQQSQKLVKAWLAAAIRANGDIVTSVQATAKEAAKMFDLPKAAQKD